MDKDKIGPLTNDLNSYLAPLPEGQAANKDAAILASDLNSYNTALKVMQANLGDAGHLVNDLNSYLTMVKGFQGPQSIDCGKPVSYSGSVGYHEYILNMGDEAGWVCAYYDMRVVPDSLDLYYKDDGVNWTWQAGTGSAAPVPPTYAWVSGKGCVCFYYDPVIPDNYTVKVVIDGSSSGTIWWFILNCPTGTSCKNTLANGETKTFTVPPGAAQDCNSTNSCCLDQNPCDYTLVVCGCSAPKTAGKTYLEKVTLEDFTVPAGWQLDTYTNYEYESGKTYQTTPPYVGFYACTDISGMTYLAPHQAIGGGEVLWQQGTESSHDYPLHNIFFRLYYTGSGYISGSPSATVTLKCEITEVKVAYLVTANPSLLTLDGVFDLTIQAVIKGTTTPITDYVPSGNINLLVCNTDVSRTTDTSNVLATTVVSNTGWSNGAKTIANSFSTLSGNVSRYIGAHGPSYLKDGGGNLNQNIGIEAGETLVSLKTYAISTSILNPYSWGVSTPQNGGSVSAMAHNDFGNWVDAYYYSSPDYQNWPPPYDPPNPPYNPEPYCHDLMFGGGGVNGWVPDMFNGSVAGSVQDDFNNCTYRSGGADAALTCRAHTGGTSGGTGYYNFSSRGLLLAGSLDHTWPTAIPKSNITSVWVTVHARIGGALTYRTENVYINAAIVAPTVLPEYGIDLYSLTPNIGRWNFNWACENTTANTYFMIPGLTGSSPLVQNYTTCRIIMWFSYWQPNPYDYDYPCPDPPPFPDYSVLIQDNCTLQVSAAKRGLAVTY